MSRECVDSFHELSSTQITWFQAFSNYAEIVCSCACACAFEM